MSTLPLTEQQEKLWRFIASCERSPSYDEMAAALDNKSKGPISAMVLTLKKKGFVTYRPGQARTVVALDPRLDLSNFSTAELASELARRLAT